MQIFICENSIDGIFSGIYRAYESRLGHNNIRLAAADALLSYELFCQYEEVPVNPGNSRKVAATLRSRLGQEAYRDICQAISACETEIERRKNMDKAEAVYKTVVLGLSMKNGSGVLSCLGNPYVARVFQLARSAGNEAHHLLGFLLQGSELLLRAGDLAQDPLTLPLTANRTDPSFTSTRSQYSWSSRTTPTEKELSVVSDPLVTRQIVPVAFPRVTEIFARR